jgi:hypothetical protein
MFLDGLKTKNFYKEQLKKNKVDNVSNFIHSILDADITKDISFLINAFLDNKMPNFNIL